MSRSVSVPLRLSPWTPVWRRADSLGHIAPVPDGRAGCGATITLSAAAPWAGEFPTIGGVLLGGPTAPGGRGHHRRPQSDRAPLPRVPGLWTGSGQGSQLRPPRPTLAGVRQQRQQVTNMTWARPSAPPLCFVACFRAPAPRPMNANGVGTGRRIPMAWRCRNCHARAAAVAADSVESETRRAVPGLGASRESRRPYLHTPGETSPSEMVRRTIRQGYSTDRYPCLISHFRVAPVVGSNSAKTRCRC